MDILLPKTDISIQQIWVDPFVGGGGAKKPVAYFEDIFPSVNVDSRMQLTSQNVFIFRL